MATRSLALHRGALRRETFYVVRHDGSAGTPSTVTVAHALPAGAEELGMFSDPSRAIDFAETIVREQNGTGSAVVLVDPPYGLVGGG